MVKRRKPSKCRIFVAMPALLHAAIRARAQAEGRCVRELMLQAFAAVGVDASAEPRSARKQAFRGRRTCLHPARSGIGLEILRSTKRQLRRLARKTTLRRLVLDGLSRIGFGIDPRDTVGDGRSMRSAASRRHYNSDLSRPARTHQ